MDFNRRADHDVRDSVSFHALSMGAKRHLNVTHSLVPSPEIPFSTAEIAERAEGVCEMVPRRSLRAQRSNAFLGAFDKTGAGGSVILMVAMGFRSAFQT